MEPRFETKKCALFLLWKEREGEAEEEEEEEEDKRKDEKEG